MDIYEPYASLPAVPRRDQGSDHKCPVTPGPTEFAMFLEQGVKCDATSLTEECHLTRPLSHPRPPLNTRKMLKDLVTRFQDLQNILAEKVGFRFLKENDIRR